MMVIMPSPIAPTRIAGLDLIRGLAIALVLLRHAWPGYIGNAGIVGVVVFFTLSGYIITGVLQRDLERSGSIRYGRFYRNRMFRLMPALALTTAAFAVVELQWNTLGDRDQVWRSSAVALTYVADIPGLGEISGGLSHLWTLAVEEQFYLVWPLLLTFAIRKGVLGRMVLVLSVASLALCAVTLVAVSPDYYQVYRLPTSWAISLFIGAAAYLWRDDLERVTGRHTNLISTIGLVFLFAFAFTPDWKAEPVLYLVGAPLISLATVGLFITAERWVTLPSPALAPLLYLGTISYGAYLWNYLIASWLDLGDGGGWKSPASIILTILAASASWYVVERPVQKFRAHLDRRRADRVSV